MGNHGRLPMCEGDLTWSQHFYFFCQLNQQKSRQPIWVFHSTYMSPHHNTAIHCRSRTTSHHSGIYFFFFSSTSIHLQCLKSIHLFRNPPYLLLLLRCLPSSWSTTTTTFSSIFNTPRSLYSFSSGELQPPLNHPNPDMDCSQPHEKKSINVRPLILAPSTGDFRSRVLPLPPLPISN